MRKVGQILKEVRQQKNLSIQDIAFALKISGRTLSALENSEEKELPAKAFVRGFAKSYARYLKIDSEEFNTALATEFGENEPRRSAQAPEKINLEETVGSGSYEKPTSEKKLDKSEVEDELSQLNQEGSRRSFMYLGLGIILVILIGISKKIIDRYQREIVTSSAETTKALNENTTVPIPSTTNSATSSSSNSTLDNTTAPAKAELSTATTSPSASTTSSTATAPASSVAQNPSVATTSVAVPTTTPTPAPPSAAPPVEKPAASKPVVPETPAPIPNTPATNPPTKPVGEEVNYKLKNVEVIVEALGSIEIEYSSKSFPTGKVRLNKGQLHIFKSKNGLKLSFNNGGLARLAVNGKDVGNPGQLGKPTVVIY